MHATAASRIVNVIGIIISINEYLVLIDSKEFLSNVNSKCPAIKFAVSRTHSVIGRIKFLTISIITMKDTRAVGVPCGTRCVNI